MLAAAALLRSGCSRSSRRALAVAKPAARSMSWVKDVTVNVTFINHEVSASDDASGPRYSYLGCIASASAPLVLVELVWGYGGTHYSMP